MSRQGRANGRLAVCLYCDLWRWAGEVLVSGLRRLAGGAR